MVDAHPRTVTVYTVPQNYTVHHERESIDGGDVLPGFFVELSRLFGELVKRSPGPV